MDDVQVRRSNTYHGLLKRIEEGCEVSQSELVAAGATLGLSAEQVQMDKDDALRAHFPEHQPE